MEVVTDTKNGYKKTKLGWIPEDWKLKCLGDIGKIRMCKRIFNHETSEEGDIPFFKIGTFGKEADAYISHNLYEDYKKRFSHPKKGDILLSAAGTLGRTVVYDGTPSYFQDSNIVWIDNDESLILNDFLIYIYQIVRYESEGGTIQRLYNKTINEAKFFCPPLPEQKKIAPILSTWDKAIEQNQNLIEQLKNRKKGLMQQLLTGKTRLKGFSGEWKKYQIGDLASNYNQINKDNKVQEVLSCTKYDGLVRSLEYFGRKVYGDDLSKYKVVPSGYFAYATNHIEEGSIGYQNILDFGLVSPMYTVFKTNDKVDDSFFFKLLKTDKLIYYYQSNMSGSIARRGGLRWNVFETIVVKVPTIEEQQAIAKVLTTADKEIKAQETYLKQLQDQKKGLMQQLLTGQKRVKI